MGVPAAAQRIFDFSRPAVKELERQIVTTVRTFSEDHEYLFVSRLKSLESFSEKLETGRFKSVSGVVDLFGCTVVVPTAAHEQTVIDFLNGVYICEDVRDRSSAQKAPDVFRFDATRYVGRFKPQPGVTYSPNIDKYLFEVQIRTIFEYAWSVVTHDLVYKADEIDWRRLRLAAQLKAAVEQIEMIIAAFEFVSRGDCSVSKSGDRGAGGGPQALQRMDCARPNRGRVKASQLESLWAEHHEVGPQLRSTC